jgi:hypothetical protein
MRRNTRWEAVYSRLYKGQDLLVHKKRSRWLWSTWRKFGAAHTAKAAMRAAEKAVDTELRPTDTSKRKR